MMPLSPDELSAFTMESGARLAGNVGMVPVEDPTALQDGQQVLIATPTGILEFGMVEVETQLIHSSRWVFYRLIDTGRTFCEVIYDDFPNEPSKGKHEVQSLLPEGSIIYTKHTD